VRTRRVVALCVVPKTMNFGVDLALERAAQIFSATQATGRTVKELHAHWKKSDPKYAKAYARVKIEMKRASNFIHARTQARLTQAQLAARLDATQAVISRIESGRFLPSRQMLRRLCSATGAEIEVR
jgi:ribosome-binding protein aMBF1 (putative translation factor)